MNTKEKSPSYLSSVSNHYTDGQNVTHIDGYKTKDQNEEATPIAAICRDSGKVIWKNTLYINNPKVKKAIKAVTKHIIPAQDILAKNVFTAWEKYKEYLEDNNLDDDTNSITVSSLVYFVRDQIEANKDEEGD